MSETTPTPSFFSSKQNGILLFAASIMLGLAPFFPEPHLLGKIKWIAGGAVGMDAADWLDVLFHGAAPIILIIWIVGHFIQKGKTT